MAHNGWSQGTAAGYAVSQRRRSGCECWSSDDLFRVIMNAVAPSDENTFRPFMMPYPQEPMVTQKRIIWKKKGSGTGDTGDGFWSFVFAQCQDFGWEMIPALGFLQQQCHRHSIIMEEIANKDTTWYNLKTSTHQPLPMSTAEALHGIPKHAIWDMHLRGSLHRLRVPHLLDSPSSLLRKRKLWIS